MLLFEAQKRIFCWNSTLLWWLESHFEFLLRIDEATGENSTQVDAGRCEWWRCERRRWSKLDDDTDDFRLWVDTVALQTWSISAITVPLASLYTRFIIIIITDITNTTTTIIIIITNTTMMMMMMMIQRERGELLAGWWRSARSRPWAGQCHHRWGRPSCFYDFFLKF